jgi:hypothetical protein
VPAAAVIPALLAYSKVVAVKKLVVELLGQAASSAIRCDGATAPSSQGRRWHSFVAVRTCVLYCEKIRVFKAGSALKYISME